MLTLFIGADEMFNEETETFQFVGGLQVQFEHSLVSLSKWESKTKKPFLSRDGKSSSEIMLYIMCMVVSDHDPKQVADILTQENIDEITSYIDSPQSATTFGSMPERKGYGETITSELIYYWMVAFNIPFETEKWHLNRLFSLIRICNMKSQKPKKMSRAEIVARNRKLNEERKAKYGTTG